MQNPQRKHPRLPRRYNNGLPLTFEFAVFFVAVKLFSESSRFHASFSAFPWLDPLQMRQRIPRNPRKTRNREKRILFRHGAVLVVKQKIPRNICSWWVWTGRGNYPKDAFRWNENVSLIPSAFFVLFWGCVLARLIIPSERTRRKHSERTCCKIELN